ncbi:MAG: thioredoxin family protein [Pirellulaceae bacterium]
MLIRNVWKGCPVILAVLACAIISHAAEPAKEGGIKWSGDLKVAWEAASEQQRPLLVFVTTDGCIHCQKMKQTTLRDRAVQGDLKSRYVTVALNVKDEPEFIKILRIRTFPTMVVIQPNGDVLESISGYQTPKQLRDKLSSTARHASRETNSRKVR